MTKGIFITGTDTNVGKTIITAALMYLLRSNGYNSTYFKAALSGAESSGDKLIPIDTDIVCKLSNLNEDYNLLTPYVYKTAVSPHLASIIENNPIDINKIKNSYKILKEKYDYIIAEGSGGIICPLIKNIGKIINNSNKLNNNFYLLEDLIKDLNMDVIIVTRASLGTINHTLLTIKYLESVGINIKGIIVNEYENTDLFNDNIDIITSLTTVPILAKINKISNKNHKESFFKELKTSIKKSLKVEDLINVMSEI